jgi:CMP-N,N'-diacetyllegionaminic acid synthase
MVKIIGLITARGGSKGIPHKNILNLAGKPLIAWTINAALESNQLSRLIISTDDNEIKKIAEQYGAEVPFIRPDYLAGDSASSLSVVNHAIQFLLDEGFQKSDYILLLQPTSPLRSANDIKNAINLMQRKDAMAVVSVSESSDHPYLTRKISPEGILENFMEIIPDNLRRQDLPPAYVINGAIYLNRISSLLDDKTLLPEKKTFAYIMPREHSIDIDTPGDFHLAELILKDLQKK